MRSSPNTARSLNLIRLNNITTISLAKRSSDAKKKKVARRGKSASGGVNTLEKSSIIIIRILKKVRLSKFYIKLVLKESR